MLLKTFIVFDIYVAIHIILKILLQISGLAHVNVPVMLMPDDFEAYSKIRVDNHYFNK